jgi:Tfp pilus assembly protein PilF
MNLAVAAWNASDWPAALAMADEEVAKQPLAVFWLTLQGFAAYQVATAQIDSQAMLENIEKSVYALRKSLILPLGNLRGRAEYVLGKAYYQKGAAYADLCVEYLNRASADGYIGVDSHEYLGLAYAALRDYRRSIVEFSQTLGGDPSELLLLAIARSYCELGEAASAKPYLLRCLEIAKDVEVAVKARLLLGKLYFDSGDAVAAQAEFDQAISADDRSADAHFWLGEISAAAGDAVKARAEWRKAIKIDPTHELARARLSN